MIRDPWSQLASKHLTRLVMTAALKGTRDYCPDQTPELSKAGRVGPLSAQIAQILQQHANVWADDMRTAAAADLDVDQEATWKACIAEADAAIDKLLVTHKTRAA
jgi:hypothetical protein